VRADHPTLRRARRLLAQVARRLPFLAGLAHRAQLVVDPDCKAAAIDCAAVRIALNPAWCDDLLDDDLMFVLAHELMHVHRGTAPRGQGADALRWNFAHDLVINRDLAALIGPPRVLGAVRIDERHDAETAYIRIRGGYSPRDRFGEWAEGMWQIDCHEAASPELDRARRGLAGFGMGMPDGDGQSYSLCDLDPERAFGDRGVRVPIEPIRPWPSSWSSRVGGGLGERVRSYRRPSRRADGGDAILAGRHRERAVAITAVIPVVPAFLDVAHERLGMLRAFADDCGADTLRLIGCDEDGVVLDQELDVATWDAQWRPRLLTMHRIDGGTWDGELCRCTGCKRPHAAPRASRGEAAIAAVAREVRDEAVIVWSRA
jgi:hypothetical protein